MRSKEIILEDDCLPSQSFFWFCEELLDRYQKDTRIFMISGYNYKGTYGVTSYFFSNIGGIWGWATWSRAWSYYKSEFEDLENIYGDQFSKLKHLLGPVVYKRRESHWNSLQKGIDTWDYQWSFVRHFNHGLSCVPSSNLIKNIGFGADATHTKQRQDSPPFYEIELPLSTNYCLLTDSEYDDGIHGGSNKYTFLKKLTNYLNKRSGKTR